MTSMSPVNGSANMAAASPVRDAVSPRQAASPKTVAFELLFANASEYRARLPMRVQIYPHDATESIVTTVKNFYGIYSDRHRPKGISFEDKDGNTLIARYENFSNGMVVYVRVFDEYSAETPAYDQQGYQAPVPGAPSYSPDAYGGQAIQSATHDTGRPISRTSRRRSRSPIGMGEQRDASTGSNGQKRRSRPAKNPSSLSQADAYSDYSSDDGAHSTASGRMKEQLGNTDISVENIVEGGRRKRAKFESSELPLFAPPQMPAATSNPSVSPARRVEHHRPSLSLGYSGQNPFTNPRPIQASQTYNNMQHNNMYAPHTAEVRRHRNSVSMTGNGILPTPDPTVGSCVSEEDKDVALQLMRLGDMSNISHGRTSASTLDDTFSGKADAASSTGATSDSEGESEDEHPAQRRKLESGASQAIYQTTEARFMPPAGDAEDVDNKPKIKAPPKPKAVKNKTKTTKAPRPAGAPTVKKLPPVPGGPLSPASAASSRKPSIASANGLVPGEDDQPDLSSKPRCQRCRKSKKGCDRQRPCGRCRDAGLTADQCISEDEGNGRKGRYGRHMGVPIKTEEVLAPVGPPTLLPAAPITMPAIMSSPNKDKKRKR